MYIDDANQASSLSVVKPKISYAEAIKYFEKSEKEISNNDYKEIKTELPEDLHVEVQCYINKIINKLILIDKLLISYVNICRLMTD